MPKRIIHPSFKDGFMARKLQKDIEGGFVPSGVYDRTKNPRRRYVLAKPRADRKQTLFGPDDKKRRRRHGSTSQAEAELIGKFVHDQPRPITPEQVTSLATLMRRSERTVKDLIIKAREQFAASAERYVEIHKTATENALADGDNEQALKGSQWALEKISYEGQRVVEKSTEEATGSRIMIGIKVGGIDATRDTKSLPEVTTRGNSGTDR